MRHSFNSWQQQDCRMTMLFLLHGHPPYPMHAICPALFCLVSGNHHRHFLHFAMAPALYVTISLLKRPHLARRATPHHDSPTLCHENISTLCWMSFLFSGSEWNWMSELSPRCHFYWCHSVVLLLFVTHHESSNNNNHHYTPDAMSYFKVPFFGSFIPSSIV